MSYEMKLIATKHVQTHRKRDKLAKLCCGNATVKKCAYHCLRRLIDVSQRRSLLLRASDQRAARKPVVEREVSTESAVSSSLQAVLFDHLARLFGDRIHCCLQMRAYLQRHDARIDYPETMYTVHLSLIHI